MIPELPKKDVQTPKSAEAGHPAAPPLSSVRMRLLQTYEAEVLDFVVDRLELGVDENRIVEQLHSHSFTDDEAHRLVGAIASDETLRIVPATDRYEKDLLEFVADHLKIGTKPRDIVRDLKTHDLPEGEAARLVDALIADPDLRTRSREAVAAEASIGVFNIFIGSCVLLLGVGFLATWWLMVEGGYSSRILFIAGVLTVILAPFQIVMGITRIFNAKTRRVR